MTEDASARPSNHAKDAAEPQRIQIDRYIIIPHRPVAAPTSARPQSWRSVFRSVNASLRSLSVGVFDLLDVTVKSATDVVRGLGALPHSVNQRIRGGVNPAQSASSNSDPESLVEATFMPGLVGAAEAIQHLIEKKRSEGFLVGYTDIGGAPTLYFLEPSQGEQLKKMLEGEPIHGKLGAASEGERGKD